MSSYNDLLMKALQIVKQSHPRAQFKEAYSVTSNSPNPSLWKFVFKENSQDYVIYCDKGTFSKPIISARSPHDLSWIGDRSGLNKANS